MKDVTTKYRKECNRLIQSIMAFSRRHDMGFYPDQIDKNKCRFKLIRLMTGLTRLPSVITTDNYCQLIKIIDNYINRFLVSLYSPLSFKFKGLGSGSNSKG